MTEETQESIECKAAIRAALEKVGEYCGLGGMGGAGHTIEFAGATIGFPEEIYQIAIDEALEDDICIKDIAASGWAVNQAKALCLSMFEGEALEAEACVEKVAVKLAEKIVKPIRSPEEAYADRYVEGLGK